jgi:GTPase SAR1 family protein
MTTPTVGAGAIQEIVKTQHKSFAGVRGLVYFDVADESSFEDAPEFVRRLFQDNAEKDATVVVGGNTTDLVEERTVTEVAARVGRKLTTDCLALPVAA